MYASNIGGTQGQKKDRVKLSLLPKLMVYYQNFATLLSRHFVFAEFAKCSNA